MFPEIEAVETPFGPAESVWATSETHIGMRGTFTINRVDYRVRLDLHFREGEWQPGDKDDWSAKFHALMIDRVWNYPGGKQRPETSSSARTKAREVLIPWLAAFAVGDGAELVRLAGVQHHQGEIASKRQEIAKLENELADARVALATLEEGA